MLYASRGGGNFELRASADNPADDEYYSHGRPVDPVNPIAGHLVCPECRRATVVMQTVTIRQASVTSVGSSDQIKVIEHIDSPADNADCVEIELRCDGDFCGYIWIQRLAATLHGVEVTHETQHAYDRICPTELPEIGPGLCPEHFGSQRK